MTDIEKAGLAVMRLMAENQRLHEENEQLKALMMVDPQQPVTVLEKEEEKPDA